MANTTERMTILTRWLRALDYAAIRSAESRITGDIVVGTGRNKRTLNAVRLTDDLCLGRNKKFYKIIDNHAVVIPTSMVAEQYNVKLLMSRMQRAKLKQQQKSA